MNHVLVMLGSPDIEFDYNYNSEACNMIHTLLVKSSIVVILEKKSGYIISIKIQGNITS